MILSILLAVHCPTTAISGEIHLSAAASLKNALGEIVAEFKRAQPDTAIHTNFGASGALAKQVVQGAPVDLFISADDQWVDFLLEEDMGSADSRRILAANRLVFAGKDIAVKALADLPALQRIAIGSPASVPAGRYAAQAMQAAGVYAELAQKKKLVMAQDVRQALLYADRGEADGAFVYATDALLAGRATVLFEVPEELHDRIVYPMIMTKAGAARPEVRQLFSSLAGPEAASILRQHGFVTER